MPRVSPIQSNFNSGEFSPLLQGRVDAPRYKEGLGTCLNAIPLLQGPMIRRSGSKFVAATKTPGNRAVLVPFKFSNTQAYVLEFGDLYVRFYTNREQLVSGMAAYEIATLIPLIALPQLKWTQSLDALYLTSPVTPPMKLLRYGAVDWVIQSLDFKDGPYLNEGLDPTVCSVTSIKHKATLNAAAATGQIAITTKSGDYAALAIPAMANNGSGAIRITLTDNDEFADRSQIFISGALGTTNANGTWKAKKIDATHYDLIGSVFNAPYTANSGQICPAPFIPNDVGGLNGFVGRLVRIKFAGTAWGYGKVIGYTDGAHVLLQVINTLGNSGATPEFQLGAWGYLRYPACCTFHDDRLYLGGPDQTIYGSNTSDYENFAPTDDDTNGTQLASNGVAFAANSNDANTIAWMASDEYGMPLGTTGGPFVMRASSLNEALTPLNVSCKRIDNIGVADLMPVSAGKSTIYLSKSTRKIYEMTYYYNIDGFRKIDLTEIAQNLPAEGITSNLAFQSSPQPIVWCARDDGTFLGMTFDRNLDTLRTGWSRHKLGGVSDTAGTPPVIESFAVIPSPDAAVDDVWVIVRRYINGQTVRYIEYLDKIFEEFDEYKDYAGADCGATFDNPVAVLGITSANPAVVHAVAHGLITGNSAQFENVVGLKSNTGTDKINGIPFVVTVVDADHISLDGFDSTALTAYVSGGSLRKLVTTISGITWLEGETVSILADAKVQAKKTVVGGAITLDTPATVIQFGLGYSMRAQQLRLEAGAADGTSMGKNRRIHETAVMLNRSFDFEIGMGFDDMTPVVVANNADNNSPEDPLFTGILGQIQVISNYDFQNQLAFRVDDPTPFCLVAVMPQQVTYDKG